MKNAITNIIHSITGFVSTHTVAAVAIIATVAVTAVAVPVGVHYANSDKPQSVGEATSDIVSVPEEDNPFDVTSSEAASSETSSVEDVVSREANSSKDTASKDTTSKGTVSKETSSIKVQSPNRPSTNTSSQTASKAPVASSKPSTDTVNSQASNKKDYLDTSKLTYTQADVGKVVGYSSLINQDVTIISVVERCTADGRKIIETKYSFGSPTKIIECKYCHKFPCPDGGGEDCSKYNVKEDGGVTCQTCGKPLGDGYNGTCEVLIDWKNGGKASCNYYD